MKNKKNLVISQNQLGYTVYDKEDMSGIDVFPNTIEGLDRMKSFVDTNYGDGTFDLITGVSSLKRGK